MARIMVIGAAGQLGVDVCAQAARAGHSLITPSHAELDLAQEDSIVAALERDQPDLVINTAAMHQVERCEADPRQAFAVNTIGVRRLAMQCQRQQAVLIHVSTDYVFDGAKQSPYDETDTPRPLNVYGNSKLAGENAVLAECEQAFVVRVSGLYGHSPCRDKGGMNFVQRMLTLAAERPEIRVVDDEILTPTHTRDIARQLLVLAQSRAYGLVHATAQGQCSWYQFAQHILRAAGYQGQLNKADPGEFPAKVRRPKYCVLDNQVLGRNGLDVMPHWRDGLDAYLRDGPETEHDIRSL
ncbi:dTDP-4-dehydrorhamnose reductase [Magnetospirillum sp. 64-120]|uniref:dTDP-4-dehydrorhamnose reductase n=1 Tax=Magnetospirillum sp. 64-120 TaxID=1895778 RepID=UPI000926138F|nr:dTDP-4-dehydrorhamnose reductase [Magnetospirillum sp. 64-120]OJX82954.1 MAG: dTDP-4-dehydrorhamnose reductase [Magnetospirillum sp. 64-120]